MILNAYFSQKSIRWWQTFNLQLGVFGIGLCIAVCGVALLDLSEIYEAEVDSVVYILSTRSIGSIVACLAGGFIFSKLNGQIVLLLSTLVGGISLAVVPICASVAWMHVACFILGASVGLIEIGANVWLIVIWKERGPSVLQFYHFIFGLGAVIAPFITEPYLSRRIVLSSESLETNSTETAIPDEFTASKIYLPFIYFGAVFVVAAVLMLFAYFAQSDDFCNEDDSSAGREKVSKQIELLMVALICLYVLLGVAAEQSYASMCTVYVVDNLGFSKSSAAYLASVFWGSFTISRVVATLLSIKIEPLPLIIINHIFLMLSALVLVFFPVAEVVIWPMTALYAFTLSPFFGNVCGWALKYVFLNHKYMSAIIISVCVGATLPPITVGPFIQRYPMSFMYANLTFAGLMTLVTAGLVLIGRHIDATRPRKDAKYDPVELRENES